MITSLLSSNPSYKKKFKQRWSTIPPISMKRTTTSNNWTVKKDNLWSWKSRSWFGTVRPNYATGLNQLYVFFSLLYCSISNKSHVQTRLFITFFIFHNLSQKPLKTFVWLCLFICFTCYFWDTRVFDFLPYPGFPRYRENGKSPGIRFMLFTVGNSPWISQKSRKSGEKSGILSPVKVHLGAPFICSTKSFWLLVTC
jgi:hypothetical protein